jgi:hypothetical protein
VYYEIILFSQNGGLQQILIFHEQGDTYANQISERVLNCRIKNSKTMGKLTF